MDRKYVVRNAGGALVYGPYELEYARNYLSVHIHEGYYLEEYQSTTDKTFDIFDAIKAFSNG